MVLFLILVAALWQALIMKYQSPTLHPLLQNEKAWAVHQGNCQWLLWATQQDSLVSDSSRLKKIIPLNADFNLQSTLDSSDEYLSCRTQSTHFEATTQWAWAPTDYGAPFKIHQSAAPNDFVYKYTDAFHFAQPDQTLLETFLLIKQKLLTESLQPDSLPPEDEDIPEKWIQQIEKLQELPAELHFKGEVEILYRGPLVILDQRKWTVEGNFKIEGAVQLVNSQIDVKGNFELAEVSIQNSKLRSSQACTLNNVKAEKVILSAPSVIVKDSRLLQQSRLYNYQSTPQTQSPLVSGNKQIQQNQGATPFGIQLIESEFEGIAFSIKDQSEPYSSLQIDKGSIFKGVFITGGSVANAGQIAGMGMAQSLYCREGEYNYCLGEGVWTSSALDENAESSLLLPYSLKEIFPQGKTVIYRREKRGDF